MEESKVIQIQNQEEEEKKEEEEERMDKRKNSEQAAIEAKWKSIFDRYRDEGGCQERDGIIIDFKAFEQIMLHGNFASVKTTVAEDLS